jgi:hypothetical protein
VQRKFYSLNPGKIESDFLAWYGDKKVQFSTMYSPYDPAKFGRWLTERGKPDSFYALSPSSSTSLLGITKNAHSPVNRLKSLEQLKTEVTQKFFAEFPGATVEDFQNWQEEQRREMIPADFIPSLDPMEEETAVWEGFLAWLDYEEDDD